MKDQLPRQLYRLFRGAAAMLLLAVTACDRSRSPAAPLPLPLPAPPTTRYHVSGVVTDEAGPHIADAEVVVEYAICFGSTPCWIKTVTDSGGYYDLVFEQGQGPVHGANGAAVIYSWREGYEPNIQVLPSGTPDIVRNLRLRRVRTVSAGQAITVSIDPESSLCSDLEDSWLLTSRCENVEILVGTPGTLTIEARAADAGNIIPIVFFATTGRYTTPQVGGPGTASVGVQAGERYRIFVGIPDGTAPQRYTVSTSLQTAEPPDDPD